MLAQHEILESLTTAAHGEISNEVLEAAATEIWENTASRLWQTSRPTPRPGKSSQSMTLSNP